jgi:hypothetical protein
LATKPKRRTRRKRADPEIGRERRTLDARPDTLDFRDRMYEASLFEVPPVFGPEHHLARAVPVLDQGTEGACTGFGLATVAHVLLRQRQVAPDDIDVSPRMLYEMARRYDEWPGEDYSGSSARGAMKGWHRHGICSRTLWPDDAHGSEEALDDARAGDARDRPLGAYFRVNHKDIVALHAALAEVGVLFATAIVHAGWQAVGTDGELVLSDDQLGGHAFAVVAYDRQGLWIQNSWGPGWGSGGLGHLSYDDWLANGTDLWVARLAAPVELRRETSVALSSSPAGAEAESYAYADLRPHIVTLGNDGRLDDRGTYGTSEAEVQAIIRDDLPRLTKDWPRRRVLLYAHGGLVGEKGAVQRLADYRLALLSNEVYPLSFIWRTDLWTTVGNILDDATRRRRPEGLLDASKDFMLDRLDDALEPLARGLGGKALWDEMKENAERAADPRRGSAQGGGSLTLDLLAELAGKDPPLELHVVGHSAGSIFHGPLVQLLTTKGAIQKGPLKGRQGLGLSIASLALWAPACTIDFFKDYYLPAIAAGRIERFALFTLTDEVEQDDDCRRVYNKSLLYLVANAFEAKPRIWPIHKEGTPLLGMERFVEDDKDLQTLFSGKNAAWIRSPNERVVGQPTASRATTHGGFDDDRATVLATLARIIGRPVPSKAVEFQPSARSQRVRRQDLVRDSGSMAGVGGPV